VRPNRRALGVGGVAWAAFACAAVLSCLGATQIEVHVTTNARCEDSSRWSGVSIYVGATADVETKAPTLTTTACDANGQVGSLVIVPTGANNDEIGIRVVAGLTRQPEECAANYYEGCIVARRAIRFNPHKSLDLNIALTDDCIGISCDPSHTCVNRECVDSHSAAPDALADGGPQTVRCGDNGVRCPTSGDVCCLSVDVAAGTTHGECMNPTSCPPTSMVLNCDKESDCAGPKDDAGNPNLCCLEYTVGAGNGNQPAVISGSQCLSYNSCVVGHFANELCSDRQPCVNGTLPCGASSTVPVGLMPGYFWCALP
jgi:hypothetical protein